jgi:polysaccharide biosynthesis PFTS motif protein
LQAMKTDKKIIIFEEVNNAQRWIISLYLSRGYHIYFFKVGESMKKLKWIERYLEEGRMQEIEFNQRLEFYDGLADTEAFENTEKVYPYFIQRNSFLNRMKVLYGDTDIELVFKKILSKKLSRFYYLNINMHRIENHYSKNGRDILFVPVNNRERQEMPDGAIADYFFLADVCLKAGALFYDCRHVRFPHWLVALNRVKSAFDHIFVYIKILATAFLLLFKALPETKPGNVNYKYGIVVLSPRQLENDIKSIDFLADAENVKRDEMVFIQYNRKFKMPKSHLARKKLHYIDDIDKGFEKKYIFEVLPFIGRLLNGHPMKDIDSLETSLRLIYFYVRWRSLEERVKLGNLITQLVDNTAQALARDILLKKRGIKIWKYMDAANIVNYFVPVNQFLRTKNSTYSYMYCDNLVCWSEDNISVFKNTRSRIQNYLNVGCLWSEHVRQIEEGEIKSTLRDDLYQNGFREGMKIIGVFDSTYYDHCINTCKDGIKFLEGILALSEEDPEVFVIVKEKKARSVSREKSAEIGSIYDKLSNSPRVYLPGNKTSPSEVIALSDITIAFPFSSTALEALAVNRRGLWYDAADKFRGTFYDQAPGLVCHNQPELISRVKELLYCVSDEEYAQYLANDVRKQFDIRRDGFGITRFRRLLAEHQRVAVGQD